MQFLGKEGKGLEDMLEKCQKVTHKNKLFVLAFKKYKAVEDD